MKKGHVDYAERQALNVLDEWLDVTGAISIHSSWYYELQSVVEDAVHIGIQMALNGEIKKDSDGNVVKGDCDNIGESGRNVTK